MRSPFSKSHNLVLVALLTSGCIDPKADYEEYLQRPVPIREAGVSDVTATPCQELLQQDLSGKLYGSCFVKATQSPFSLSVDQTVIPSADGLTGELRMSFAPLIVMATNVSQIAGEVVTLPPTTIDSECRFVENIGTLLLPAAANTFGRDLEAENVVLRGKLLSPDRSCAELDGNVPRPLVVSLAEDGDICVYMRVEPDSPIPAINPDDYVCDPSTLIPR
jgi:hypothetical protein